MRLGLFAGLLALIVAGLSGPTPAGAHADLLRAEPEPGSRVAQPPAQLTLFFSQALKQEGSFVIVEDASGARLPVNVALDPADRKIMRATVSGMQPGVYRVLWQTLSADDDDYHDGSYQIVVLNPDGSLPPGAEASQESTGGSSNDTLMLIVISALVVAGVGGLALFLRRTARKTP